MAIIVEFISLNDQLCWVAVRDCYMTDNCRIHHVTVPIAGCEFEPRPGHYSRMSFSSDQATGTVFPHLNMPFLPNSKFI